MRTECLLELWRTSDQNLRVNIMRMYTNSIRPRYIRNQRMILLRLVGSKDRLAVPTTVPALLTAETVR